MWLYLIKCLKYYDMGKTAVQNNCASYLCNRKNEQKNTICFVFLFVTYFNWTFWVRTFASI